MSGLANYHSDTYSMIPNENISNTEGAEFIDGPIQLSETRINSFFKKPSVETEFDENLNSCTDVSTPNSNDNLLRLVQQTVYRYKTSTSSQKWRGYVTKKNDDYFTAIITDCSTNHPDEEVDLPLEIISPDDLHLVVEGALFDWHIGYEKNSGTTQKYSKILFRRMPRWTISDFEQANELKNKFKEFLSNQPE
ncbi:hypothetical protein [uncultured Desulfobacter sp.]|uniref:hypothetical protein n=1 Tax=uncultured Desulfobacter sp. TaxID=240139 RepID=UPI0029F561B0|nr:hypothetical protein [uncultured Desulfobacter sp.]